MLRVVAGSDAAVWVGIFELAWTHTPSRTSWTQPLVMGSVVRVSDLVPRMKPSRVCCRGF